MRPSVKGRRGHLVKLKKSPKKPIQSLPQLGKILVNVEKLVNRQVSLLIKRHKTLPKLKKMEKMEKLKKLNLGKKKKRKKMTRTTDGICARDANENIQIFFIQNIQFVILKDIMIF